MKKFHIIILAFTLTFTLTTAIPLVSAQKAERAYTNYNITLDEAVDIQVNDATNPITDLYQDAPAFLHVEDLELVGPNKIAVFAANIRTAPSFHAEVAFQFPKMAPVHIIGIETGEGYDTIRLHSASNSNREKNKLWYKIAYKAKSYYIHSSLVTANQVRATSDTKIYERAGKNHHAFGNIKKGETLTIAELGSEWLQVYYKNWRAPKRDDVKTLLDPSDDEKNMFQHIRLDTTIGASATELNQVLENKGILEGYGQAFIDGAKEYGVNEAYLISHAFLETGLGTSELATGVEVGINDKEQPVVVTESNRENLKKIKTTYNMFGIGAADSCPIDCGAKTAYENEWFDPETAIHEGAAWIGEGYIYNEFEQNTLYKMKWNPKMGEGQHWKQYATDIGWAEKQTEKIKEIYEQLTNPNYFYDIPVYKEKS